MPQRRLALRLATNSPRDNVSGTGTDGKAPARRDIDKDGEDPLVLGTVSNPQGGPIK
jgi:hypothetical protein